VKGGKNGAEVKSKELKRTQVISRVYMFLHHGKSALCQELQLLRLARQPFLSFLYPMSRYVCSNSALWRSLIDGRSHYDGTWQSY
jgi:hypothetical protein